jgi:methyl-accepting chemotaxis protein
VASHQVTKNTGRIAQMSEENSAAVAHISHTARDMEAKAGVLEGIVRRFKLSA